MKTKLIVAESSSSSYAPRTFHNAKNSDLTIAFAVDFTTAGEKLTHKAAGTKYVRIEKGTKVSEAVAKITEAIDFHNAFVLNIAGNGLYTLVKHGYTQDKVNRYVFKVLRKVVRSRNILLIRTGGQTGVDLAGAIAARALGLETIVMMPRGFLQRNAEGFDYTQSKEDVEAQIVSGAARLKDKT